VVPDRVALAGDWHGNTAWAVRAVRKMAALLPPDGPRVIVHLGDFGIWPGARGGSFNWAILDIRSMRWLHVAGQPISNAVRGLAGLLGEPHDVQR
jgi:hypothetical protein